MVPTRSASDCKSSLPELVIGMAEILKNNVDEVIANEGSRKSVPVTIVTGFLGSGKTTLLNYILTAKHGKRIAVIENEFGDEIGVESLIAKDGANGEWFDEFFRLETGAFVVLLGMISSIRWNDCWNARISLTTY